MAEFSAAIELSILENTVQNNIACLVYHSQYWNLRLSQKGGTKNWGPENEGPICRWWKMQDSTLQDLEYGGTLYKWKRAVKWADIKTTTESCSATHKTFENSTIVVEQFCNVEHKDAKDANAVPAHLSHAILIWCAATCRIRQRQRPCWRRTRPVDDLIASTGFRRHLRGVPAEAIRSGVTLVPCEHSRFNCLS